MSANGPLPPSYHEVGRLSSGERQVCDKLGATPFPTTTAAQQKEGRALPRPSCKRVLYESDPIAPSSAGIIDSAILTISSTGRFDTISTRMSPTYQTSWFPSL